MDGLATSKKKNQIQLPREDSDLPYTIEPRHEPLWCTVGLNFHGVAEFDFSFFFVHQSASESLGIQLSRSCECL